MLRLQLSVPNAGGSCGLRTGDSDRDFRVKFNKFSFTHDAAAAVAATAAGKLELRGDALSEMTVALRLAARSSLTFSGRS
jgi:hypothetical protein